MTTAPFIHSRHRDWLRTFHALKQELHPRLPTMREYARFARLRSSDTATYRVRVLRAHGYLHSLSAPTASGYAEARSIDISEKGMAALGLRGALASPSRDIDGGGCL